MRRANVPGVELSRAHFRRRTAQLAGPAPGGRAGIAAGRRPHRRPHRSCRTCSSESAGRTPARPRSAWSVNSNNVILDDIWAWRADHGPGVGWTSEHSRHGRGQTGTTSLATGLFVEHYQKYEVIWNEASTART